MGLLHKVALNAFLTHTSINTHTYTHTLRVIGFNNLGIAHRQVRKRRQHERKHRSVFTTDGLFPCPSVKDCSCVAINPLFSFREP